MKFQPLPELDAIVERVDNGGVEVLSDPSEPKGSSRSGLLLLLVLCTLLFRFMLLTWEGAVPPISSPEIKHDVSRVKTNQLILYGKHIKGL